MRISKHEENRINCVNDLINAHTLDWLKSEYDKVKTRLEYWIQNGVNSGSDECLFLSQVEYKTSLEISIEIIIDEHEIVIA